MVHYASALIPQAAGTHSSGETEPPRPSFCVIPRCRSECSEWVFTERFLERCEVGDRERLGLTEGVHVGPHVVDPDTLGVGLVGLTSGQKQNIGIHALRINLALRAGVFPIGALSLRILTERLFSRLSRLFHFSQRPA